MNNEKSSKLIFASGVVLAVLNGLYLLLCLIKISAFFSSDSLEADLAVFFMLVPLFMLAIFSFLFGFATDKKLVSKAGKILRLILFLLSLPVVIIVGGLILFLLIKDAFVF